MIVSNFKQNKEIVNILLSQILIDDEIKSLLATSLEQNHSKMLVKFLKSLNKQKN